ncbi:MAG: twin-arginine translocase TatA/TatE family subunit [Thermoanaerobaculia bacterium]|nr:twin-arginine translocase TatA/TatE family subunit [Thermoanaerobaculia bacterium]
MNFGVPELLIVLAIVLLLFGYSRLPQLGKGLGQGIRNFRHGLKGSDDDPDARKAESPTSGQD